MLESIFAIGFKLSENLNLSHYYYIVVIKVAAMKMHKSEVKYTEE